MARTALTPVVLTNNAVTADPAGTNLDATNSHSFVAAQPTSEYVIRVVNTTASTKTVTLKAGSNPPADATGQGDLVMSLTAGDSTATVGWFGPFASARFIQSGGTVNIDVAGSMTGKITVFNIPRKA